MSSRISAKASELKGKAKVVAGKATSDRSLEAKGKGEQVTAQAKRAFADVKNAAKRARKVVTK
jgi:uncharacterized protein YjbJ (UPF0337 family)